MKKLIIIFYSILIAMATTAQSWPVAVNDYTGCNLGQTITINVTKNDYHTNNLSFRILKCDDAISFTDSTITFFVDYEKYYNATNFDTIRISYMLVDENNVVHTQSNGFAYFRVIDNNYFDFLTSNNIRAKIQASGLQFWPGPKCPKTVTKEEKTPVFEFPNGSSKNTIYNSSIWIGGLDNDGNLKLAAERYRKTGIDYWTGPISIGADTLSVSVETAIQWQKVWKLSVEDIKYHIDHYLDLDYEPISQIATWPAHGNPSLNQEKYLAPFIDVDYDSIYNPMKGDYPLIRGDQCIFFIINDQRVHNETSGQSMGIEIHVMAYEFDADNSDPLSRTVFMSYKVFNRSSVDYTDTYFGVYTDFDIGYSKDDFVGCDVSRGAFFGYNGDNYDGNTDTTIYGDNCPAQGVLILGGPKMDSNNIDDPDGQCDESINGVGFGDGIIDNERYGMSRFVYYENTTSNTGDPEIDTEYYNYMKGVWKDGSPMEYGGNAHPALGAYGPSAKFIFPGTSDPCFWGTDGIEPFGPIEWTEETAGNTPSDRRGLSVMGPFTFEAKSMERIDIAFISDFADENKTALETLINSIDYVREVYGNDPTYFGYQWLDNEEINFQVDNLGINVFPNPVDNYITINCNINNKSANFKVLDITGNTIISDVIYTGSPQTISTSNLKSGIYFIILFDSNVSYSTKFIKM